MYILKSYLKNILGMGVVFIMTTPGFAQPTGPSNTGGSCSTTPNPVKPIVASCQVTDCDKNGWAPQPEGTTLTEQMLSCIRTYTNGILCKLNNMPCYIQTANAYFANWTSTAVPSNSTISTIQQDFSTLTQQFTTLETTQLGLQQDIVNKAFIDPKTTVQVVTSSKDPNITNTVPYVNSMTYQIFLNPPSSKTGQGQGQQNNVITIFPKDPDLKNNVAQQHYIYNASGLVMQHIIPDNNWHPTDLTLLTRYQEYYRIVSAAQTYNAYILSELLADYNNKYALSNTQKDLYNQATGCNWVTEVMANNTIGVVLREILLFNSQIFVVMTRSLEVQKQLLISQSMTNGLLIALNAGNEDILVGRANGTLHNPNS